MTEPVVHLFYLGVDQEKLESFYQAGVYNLTTSYEEEEGTLAMYASNFRNSPTEFIVFEVYADERAYHIHQNSIQYQNYIKEVGNYLTKRKSYEVGPLFLKEKLSSGIRLDSGQCFLKFAQIEVKDGEQKIFETSVIDNMRKSMKEEVGVLAMYALKDNQNLKRYYFFEVYADAKAYEVHLETEHFLTYISETKDLLIDKKLSDLENSIAVTRGNLVFT
ncbi:MULTISPECIES: putative quinol monooxygenase [Lactococcus]|uniref:putative quinol monooxygenase n=1 Tax=Lactococcus TaxID=1357 RepID=UPI00203AF8BE|nr:MULTISPECIES: antibiotic biosynthesis monooxygenase [Lactococcus]